MSACSRSTPGISITTVSSSSVSKISVFGRKNRAGIVDSSFFSSSRFCCSLSVDLDRLRLVALRAWQGQGDDAVSVLRHYPIRVELHRKANRPIEAASDALATMHADLAAVVDRL